MSFRIAVLVCIFILPAEVYSQECAADGTCDTHQRCRIWKQEGECYRDPSYMKEFCPNSCNGMKSSPDSNECYDVHEECFTWKNNAECETNASVKRYCKKSCGQCHHQQHHNSYYKRKNDLGLESSYVDNNNVVCEDIHDGCFGWAKKGECESNPNYMLKYCRKSCGVCIAEPEMEEDRMKYVEDILSKTANFGEIQTASGDKKHRTIEIVREMIEYMEQSNEFNELPPKIQQNCRNKNELCSFWAVIGECENNKSYMKIQCAPACRTCHLIDIETRCPKLPDAIPGLMPGDLNKMFERIVKTAPGNKTLSSEERDRLVLSDITNYTVTIHSRPSGESFTEIDIDADRKLPPPWVITFDNFVTEEEANLIIKAGYEQGYKRSEDVGAANFDGTVNSRKSKGRTSENAWCSTRTGCREKPGPYRVLNRIAKVVGIPAENSEDLQILKYEVGQFYNAHHDYIPHQKGRQCGPRILTFYLYLSDVEDGGGTDFPDLGITVMPKKGRALLWPSVMNTEPMLIDGRTRHQALPVEAGLKFGANAWIHMFDYQRPQTIGCN